MITAFHGTFYKKNGKSRNMLFVRLEDLPEDFLGKVTKDKSPPARSLAEGQEVVWDVQSKGFRTFNWKKAMVPPTEIKIKKDFFLLTED